MMQLAQLLKSLNPMQVIGPTTATIEALCHDSRQAAPGRVFFALRGQAHDGHLFIPQAVAAGVTAVVMEEPQTLPPQVAGIVVADSRRALAMAAAALYGDPAQHGPVVGVTGTNGKTTTTYLIEALLRQAGRHPAVFGTVSYRFGDTRLEASHTTPDPLDLLRTASEFAQAGADSLVMEVSSHALDQHRVDGISYTVGVYTNLTPEHLDYHRDMETYFASKRRFFSELLAHSGGRAVICTDDGYGRRLAAELPQALTCGVSADAQVRPRQIEVTLQGIRGELATPLGAINVETRLIGRFNLQNLLCATAAGIALELSRETIAAGLAAAEQVPGRVERIENQLGALVLVDYAHTGDALEKVLDTLLELKPLRSIAVFGCGGDRDRTKRPVMGEVVARRADLAVVTSDNPRTEDPLAIIAEIRAGVERVHPREWSLEEGAAIPGRGYVVIPDRRAAIDYAVSILRPGDLLLVAGKGHEDYQIIGRQKFHFDDREELRRALASKEASA